jgi:hypothetical protein
VVHNLIVAAETGVFVLQGIEAMRTCSHYFLHLVTLQYLDILHGHHLEQEFITSALCRVTGAGFLLSEDGKGYPAVVENSSHCFRDLSGTVVEAAGAANPEENFRGFSGGHTFGHCPDFEFHIGWGICPLKYAKNWIAHEKPDAMCAGRAILSLEPVMMRCLSLLLLLVFLFEGGGYYGLFCLKRMAIRAEMDAHVRRIKSSDHLIPLRVDGSNAHEVHWKRAHREFSYRGVMYDVVRKSREENDVVVYHVHPDKKESALYRDLEKKASRNYPDGDLPGRFLRLALSIPESPVSMAALFAEWTILPLPHPGILQSEFHGRMPLIPPDAC